mmetsp:Transcript_8094/g.18949  ORF Transcript_8094/g.18949 Transcript_8094/m.18949 type:complete len:302 (+) Transcript_8094:929-1834(+)
MQLLAWVRNHELAQAARTLHLNTSTHDAKVVAGQLLHDATNGCNCFAAVACHGIIGELCKDSQCSQFAGILQCCSWRREYNESTHVLKLREELSLQEVQLCFFHWPAIMRLHLEGHKLVLLVTLLFGACNNEPVLMHESVDRLRLTRVGVWAYLRVDNLKAQACEHARHPFKATLQGLTTPSFPEWEDSKAFAARGIKRLLAFLLLLSLCLFQIDLQDFLEAEWCHNRGPEEGPDHHGKHLVCDNARALGHLSNEEGKLGTPDHSPADDPSSFSHEEGTKDLGENTCDKTHEGTLPECLKG